MTYMRKTLAILLITLFCAVNFYSQQRPDWARYASESPVLKGAFEELRKEGYEPLFERASPPQRFGDLFVAAIIPVNKKSEPPGTKEGVLGLLVIFVKVPLLQDLQVVEVVRLRYYRTDSATTVEGQIAALTQNEVAFGEKVLVLSIDSRGSITEEYNKLIFAEVGRAVSKDCENLVRNAVQDSCRKFETPSLDWLRCRVSGWVWAASTCWHFREQ